MYSTINSYRIEATRQDLVVLAMEQRLVRSAAPREPGRPSPVARSLAAGRQVSIVMFAMLALAVALAVPVVAAPLV